MERPPERLKDIPNCQRDARSLPYVHLRNCVVTMAKAAARKPVAAGVSVTPKPLSDEDIDWETIRADYEIGKRRLSDIGFEHGIHYNRIIARAKKENWPKRGEVAEAKQLETELPQDAEALAARLTKLIAREIADIERQRKTERDEAEGERQARRLATLVRSIDKLHEIEKAARLAKRNDPEADKAKRRAEDELIRAGLESRLARLLDGGGKGRIREGADAARAAAARP